LISCTEVRATSGSAQKPGIDCRTSKAVSRSALPDKSKKLSELGDPALQVGKTVH
jgi:hypothetical protein